MRSEQSEPWQTCATRGWVAFVLAICFTFSATGQPTPKQAERQGKASRRKGTGFEITDADRAWWAFQPIQRPAPPPVKQKSWVANPIDAFVLAELEAKGLAPNAPATKREFARR